MIKFVIPNSMLRVPHIVALHTLRSAFHRLFHSPSPADHRRSVSTLTWNWDDMGADLYDEADWYGSRGDSRQDPPSKKEEAYVIANAICAC